MTPGDTVTYRAARYVVLSVKGDKLVIQPVSLADTFAPVIRVPTRECRL